MSWVPPLPSGFRPRIGVRGMLPIARNDEAAAGGIQAYLRPRNTIFVPMTNLVTGTIHPGSESGTCFRTNSRRHSVI